MRLSKCFKNGILCEYALVNGDCISEDGCHKFDIAEKLGETSNWHTRTPTEKGWYLLALTTKVFNDKPFCVAYMDGHHWLGIDDFCIFVDHVLAWQKIEPYEKRIEK